MGETLYTIGTDQQQAWMKKNCFPSLIHKLQPGCLVGNNHHQTPFAGEDIQIFERDLPGEPA